MSYTINKPTLAKKRFTFVSELESQIFKIIATGACELVSVVVTAGGSACTFRLLDAAQYATGYNLESGISFAVEASNSFSPNLNQPVPFTKGIVIICEQGEGSNAECTVTVN